MHLRLKINKLWTNPVIFCSYSLLRSITVRFTYLKHEKNKNKLLKRILYRKKYFY